jgi:hypothetical protein
MILKQYQEGSSIKAKFILLVRIMFKLCSSNINCPGKDKEREKEIIMRNKASSQPELRDDYLREGFCEEKQRRDSLKI